VENYISKLVPALPARSWQIHYFTARVKQTVPSGMIIHKIPVLRGTSITRMLSFAYGARRAVQKFDLPLVMGFGRTICQDIYRDGNGCFLDYEKSANKRFNFLYRNCYLHLEKQRFHNPRLYKVVTVSRMVKDQIINHYHLPEEKIEVAYSGVEARQLNPELKKHKLRFRKQLRIPPDAFTQLFMGNGFNARDWHI
jgi:UDP-glucose:(heptosyl)LPS alpha-1,3-glucosyltransferase